MFAGGTVVEMTSLSTLRAKYRHAQCKGVTFWVRFWSMVIMASEMQHNDVIPEEMPA